MYVCNCNGVTEQSVEAAIRAGACRPIDVHRACGTAPQCGRCLDEIEWMIEDAKETQSQVLSTA